MKALTELALANYQGHLTIIQRLYLSGVLDDSRYRESVATAGHLWRAEQESIARLEARQNSLTEGKR